MENGVRVIIIFNCVTSGKIKSRYRSTPDKIPAVDPKGRAVDGIRH
jgi:hypothetical protein